MENLQLLIDFFLRLDRQGPGSAAETKKALDLIGIDKTEALNLVDIGCGSGAQTMTLLGSTNAQITAVDLFPGFLNKLKENAKERGMDDRLSVQEQSMEQLPFDKGSLDLIWSEGAIYNMGFREGVQTWKPFLKVGGHLAVSEICWFTEERPKELKQYWEKNYAQMDTAGGKMKVLEKAGYSPVAYFQLPQYCWLEEFYEPMEKEFPSFLERHDHSEAAKELVKSHREEIRFYQQYKEYYGYGFFIGKKW